MTEAGPGPATLRTGGFQGLVARWVTGFGTALACELRRFVRHRLALVSALVLPIAMAILMTTALGGDPEVETRFAVADLDGGPGAEAFLDDALGDPAVADMVTVERVGSAAEARQAVDQERVDAAIILPDGFSASLAAPETSGDNGDHGEDLQASQPIVLSSDDNPIAGDLGSLIVDQFTIRAHATAVAAQAVDSGSVPSDDWPLHVEVTAPDGERLDGATAVGPPIALFFVLATLGFAAQSLVADRDRGVVERLAAVPTPRSALLCGRAAAGGVIGGLSLTALVVTLQLVYGQDWGPPLLLAVVITAAVAAMVGVAAAVAALARTPGQAQSLSVGLAFVFLLASGNFATGGTRPAYAVLVPNAHAFDGFSLLATENAGLATIDGSLLALAGFAVGGFVLAAVSTRRLV